MSDSPLFRIGQPFQSGWDRVPDTKDVRPVGMDAQPGTDEYATAVREVWRRRMQRCDYSFKVEECSIPEGVMLKDCRGPKTRKRWWR